MDSSSIKLRAHGIEELARLGKIFGASFLKPLLTSNKSELCSLVVSAYGPSGSGKSPFYAGCVEGLSLYPDWTFNQDGQLEEHSTEEWVFRFCDFGKFAFVRNAPLTIFESRQILGKKGVDFFKHPPLSVINSGGAVITIARLNESSLYGAVWRRWLENVKNDITVPQKTARNLALNQFVETTDDHTPVSSKKILADIDRIVCISSTLIGEAPTEIFGQFCNEVKNHFQLIS